MKLRYLLLALFMTGFMSAFSQSRLVYVSDFSDDWIFGVSGGIQKFAGTPSTDLSFSKTLSPALSINLGKWLTSAYGLRLGYNGTYFKDITAKEVSYFTIHGEFMVNVQGLIYDDLDGRLWCISPYIGTGWAGSRGAKKNDGWALHCGLYNTFRITPSLSATAELSGIFADKEFDLHYQSGEGFDKLFALTIGLAYRLKFAE